VSEENDVSDRQEIGAAVGASAQEPVRAEPGATEGGAQSNGAEPKGEASNGAAPAGVSTSELEALQAAEDAKGDPALDEVEPADIEVQEGEKEEPFDKLAAKAKKLPAERVRAIVEALLFLAEKPLTPEEVRAASGIEVAVVQKALDKLAGHYRDGVCGIVLHEVAGGWQFRSAPDVSDYARRFLRVKPQRLTRAALETLAIIAYRQPVTRPEIEDIRGVDCGAVVKALLERKLIKILGKKEEPGRPMLYGTTREFLEFFALKDLASLPTLREFHELSEEHRDIVEKEAPAEEGPKLEGLVAELADPNLRAALEAKQAEGEAALADLERAIETADEKTRAAQEALDPKAPAVEPEGAGANARSTSTSTAAAAATSMDATSSPQPSPPPGEREDDGAQPSPPPGEREGGDAP
jgi:segregation and condensation protein B